MKTGITIVLGSIVLSVCVLAAGVVRAAGIDPIDKLANVVYYFQSH